MAGERSDREAEEEVSWNEPLLTYSLQLVAQRRFASVVAGLGVVLGLAVVLFCWMGVQSQAQAIPGWNVFGIDFSARSQAQAIVQFTEQLAEPAKIFVSGLSSGADFAVHFQVAYSARVSGAAIFAGQPYMCAITRFPEDELQPPSSEVPICRGCPPNQTLIYDHCKNHPSWVKVEELKAVTEEYFKNGFIDDPSNLKNIGLYFYRGTADSHYANGSVKKTAEYFAQFASSPSNVKYVGDIPSGHAYPLPGSCPWPCGKGVLANVIPFQDCKYDGIGDALTHIYNVAGMPISSPSATSEWSWDALKWFDQEPFWGNRSITRLEKWALVYVPERCASGQQSCNLMLSFHGCGFVFPGLYEMLVVELNLNAWAEANDMVVLYPRLGAFGSTAEQKQGCWNVYGQTGADYATKSADQMKAVLQMVNSLNELQLRSFVPSTINKSDVEGLLKIGLCGAKMVGQAAQKELKKLAERKFGRLGPIMLKTGEKMIATRARTKMKQLCDGNLNEELSKGKLCDEALQS
eukprot:TRINITY_DN92068_c0_g1_i1.p1 TRINITY_DN92068_c0_g1~~TRINITY_DN92068_c0_g1_i1.p1  ORF type:complete len:520 (-),score=91.14 TRINITY_DN92068_c0_g1_i1:397-1956(-)